MMRIAVTGATGFLGSGLVTKIRESKEDKIAVFDYKKHSLFDVRSLEPLLIGSDVIYHLAGINDSDDSNVFQVNVIGTANILEATRLFAPKAHFIYSSSLAVYKVSKEKRIIKEDSILLPRNRYGFTKLLGEELIQFYFRVYNLKASILRIANVYGLDSSRGNNLVISRLIKNIRKGGTIRISGDGLQTRDFVFVDDVINALIRTQSIKDRFNILNICSRKEISIRKLAELIAAKEGSDFNVEYTPSRETDGRWRGDNFLAKEKIGWRPVIDLDKGLDKIL